MDANDNECPWREGEREGLNESSNSNTAAAADYDDAAAMPDFTLADSIHAHHVGRSGGDGGDDEGERGKMPPPPPPPLQFKPLAFCRNPSLPRWIPQGSFAYDVH